MLSFVNKFTDKHAHLEDKQWVSRATANSLNFRWEITAHGKPPARFRHSTKRGFTQSTDERRAHERGHPPVDAQLLFWRSVARGSAAAEGSCPAARFRYCRIHAGGAAVVTRNTVDAGCRY